MRSVCLWYIFQPTHQHAITYALNPFLIQPSIYLPPTTLPPSTPTGREVKALSTLLDALSIPIVLAQAYGMIGYLRLVAPCHPVVESHVENSFDDLRLDCPFPELSGTLGMRVTVRLFSSLR
ncbi:hypothetical protein SARC_17677 [Sphaeroforma arctica JP610]|uniref:Uncharacterized protein n=1 Tax=Sphaeroforma arctica JP610 TaxID=667725 RepID=A0A0L0EZ78_9EUKA|nr:hypothetical protein SARC_17677 [Sphaeroforma arctica JP610]KNC69805.1 hypothetical protein SARC_17677 [Sphaeroforma arctica JP610]|eukprot:XP_014143707.1 hypothetical protein SARC_17677 [Sphaeroforma arctica JP610]